MPVSVTAFMEEAMSSYLKEAKCDTKMVRVHSFGGQNSNSGTVRKSHLSACSASFALCTSSSFSVIFPENSQCEDISL